MFFPTIKSFVPKPLTFALVLVAVAFTVTLDTLFGTLQLYSVVALLNTGSNVQSDTVILSNVLVVSKLSVTTFPSAYTFTVRVNVLSFILPSVKSVFSSTHILNLKFFS